MNQISDDLYQYIFSFIQIYDLIAGLRISHLYNKNIKQSLTHRRTFIALREGVNLSSYKLTGVLEFFGNYCKKIYHVDLQRNYKYINTPLVSGFYTSSLRIVFLPIFGIYKGNLYIYKNVLNLLPLTLQILSIESSIDNETLKLIGDRFENLIGLSINIDYELEITSRVDSIRYIIDRCSNLVVVHIDTSFIDIDYIAINLPYCRYLYLPSIAQVHHHCNLLLFEHRLVELNYGNVWFEPAEFKIFAESLTRLKRLAIVCPGNTEYIETIEILHDKDILPHLEELSLTTGRSPSPSRKSKTKCSVLDELKKNRPDLTTYHFEINDIYFNFKSACHRAGLMNCKEIK